MRVPVVIDQDYDRDRRPRTTVICKRCHHEVEAFGHHPESTRIALVKLGDTCPLGEQNVYGQGVDSRYGPPPEPIPDDLRRQIVAEANFALRARREWLAQHPVPDPEPDYEEDQR
jgi:hypothetical protein